MAKYSKQPKKRSPSLTGFQKVVLFLMTLLVEGCIGVVALLYFGYSIPGIKLPYLSFIHPPAIIIPMKVFTATITATFTDTPVVSPTATRTVIPTRTKAPTWTLLPELITPSVTPPSTLTPPTLTGTPPTSRLSPTPTKAIK